MSGYSQIPLLHVLLELYDVAGEDDNLRDQ
jgi:hypothetical protein